MPCTKRLIERNQSQNATLYCVFKYEDEFGVTIDMTGSTAYLTIKEDAGDTDIDALAETSYAGTADGVFDLSTDISGIPLGTYRYDIVVEDGILIRAENLENDSIVINETVRD